MDAALTASPWLRNGRLGDTLPGMALTADTSDASIASYAKRNLEKIAAAGGHTFESLMQAGGAPIASTLLGATSGAVMAPSDHRGEGAVRGAIAGGLTGLAHRAINAKGAVAAQNAAQAMSREAATVDNLATQIHGHPVLPHGGHYTDVSTNSASVGGRTVHDPAQVSVAPSDAAASLSRIADKRVAGAGVGGWFGQGTPVGASVAMGGIAGSTVPDEDPRKVASTEAFEELGGALKEAGFMDLMRRGYDALPSDADIGRRIAKTLTRQDSLLSPANLGPLEKLRMRLNGGMTIADAERISGQKAIPLGTSHGTTAAPQSMMTRLRNHVLDLHGHNAESAGLSRLDQAQDYARKMQGSASGPSGFEQGFSGALEDARMARPAAVPGMGGPVQHNVGQFTPAPGLSAADRTVAESSASGHWPTVQTYPPVQETPRDQIRNMRSQFKQMHAAEDDSEILGSALTKEAAGFTHAPHISPSRYGKVLDSLGTELGAAAKAHGHSADPAISQHFANATYHHANLNTHAKAVQDAIASGDVAARNAAQRNFNQAHQQMKGALGDMHGAAQAAGQTAQTAQHAAAYAQNAANQHAARAATPPRPAAAGGAPPVTPTPPAAAAAPAAAAPAPAPATAASARRGSRSPEQLRAQDAALEQARREAQNSRVSNTLPENLSRQKAEDIRAQAAGEFQKHDDTLRRAVVNRDSTDDLALRDTHHGAVQAAALARASSIRTQREANKYLAELNANEQRLAARHAKMQDVSARRTADLATPERPKADLATAAAPPGGDAPDPTVGLPGSGADHNPWSDKNVAPNMDLTDKIKAEQTASDALMRPRIGSRAVSGALGGAATGYIAADDDHKAQGALVGGAAGGALGAGVGHVQAERAKTLVTRPLQATMHGVHDAAKGTAAATELAALHKGPTSNYQYGAGAGALASGLTSRGGRPDDQRVASAEDDEMHPYEKIAGLEKDAGLLSRLVTGAGIGTGLGAGAGWVLGNRDPNLSAQDRDGYLRRGAVLGMLAGGAGGAFAHQLANHAANPALPHPGGALSDKMVAAMGAGGASLAGGMAYHAFTGSNQDADTAKSKALGTIAAQNEAHSVASTVFAPAQSAAFARVVQSDQTLAHADPELLSDSFETMRKAAPRLATDISAVRSFLREVASYGTGPNYVTIKNLAEAEKALNQTYTAK